VEAAERFAGLEVQRGEGAPDHARPQAAGLGGGQARPGGDAAYGLPHVGVEQPSAGPGGEQHMDAYLASPAGQVGIDPR
jgi:hypothetical protein